MSILCLDIFNSKIQRNRNGIDHIGIHGKIYIAMHEIDRFRVVRVRSVIFRLIVKYHIVAGNTIWSNSSIYVTYDTVKSFAEFTIFRVRSLSNVKRKL